MSAQSLHAALLQPAVYINYRMYKRSHAHAHAWKRRSIASTAWIPARPSPHIPLNSCTRAKYASVCFARRRQPPQRYGGRTPGFRQHSVRKHPGADRGGSGHRGSAGRHQPARIPQNRCRAPAQRPPHARSANQRDAAQQPQQVPFLTPQDSLCRHKRGFGRRRRQWTVMRSR
jgi:hypothetical protein